MQPSEWDTILDRIFASEGSIASFTLVAVCAIWAAYRVIKELVREGGRLTVSVIDVFKEAMREVVGGPRVPPYERLNGLLVVGLLVLSLVLLLLFSAQSVRGLVAGSPAPLGVLAAFLFCSCLATAAGLVCVRFCARHKEDVASAKRLRNK